MRLVANKTQSTVDSKLETENRDPTSVLILVGDL